MSIGVLQVRRGRPELLREVAAGLERDRLAWLQVIAFVLAARSGAAWRGPAATASADREQGIAARIRAACVGLAVTAGALRHAADRLEGARSLVTRADRLARDAGGWVDLDGRLVLPTRPTLEDPISQAVRAREDERTRWEVAGLLRQATEAGTAVDRDLGRDLRQALHPNACVSGPPPGPAIPPPPPIRSGAAGVGEVFASAAWWRVLSGQERQVVIATHPEWIGNRDGIPARDRHQANLILLARAQAQIAADPEIRQAWWIRGTSSGPGDLGLPALIGAGPAMDRYLDLRAVRQVIDRGDPPRQLLSLDGAGDRLRAVVGIGDVDTADHVATFVGGFTTTPRGSLGRYDTQLAQVRDRTGQIARTSGMADATTAQVVWLGYDAPQQHEVLDPWGRSVLSEQTAKEAAPALARFVNGIDAARDVPPHQVIDAHSYGSVVAAHLLTHNTGVDDVVLLGSPGVGGAFTSLAGAGLKPGALNVLAADWDAVAHSGWFTGDPTEVPGALVLSSGWSLVPDLPLGTGAASSGHSDYFTAGSTSVENLAAVTLGRRDLLILDGERRKGGRP